MHKDGFTIIEVVVVFLLILAITFFVLPKNLQTTRQARLISKWNEKYNEIEYIFSAIKAQESSKIEDKLKSANSNETKKNILLDTIKPYFRIKSIVKEPYKQRYMGDGNVLDLDMYHFDNFYLTSSNDLIGLKWINKDCKGKDICAIMSFDLNGLKKPNKWGQDIFGINIYKDGIGPIGEGVNPDILRTNCSKHGSGLYCSYYYLIGGRFD